MDDLSIAFEGLNVQANAIRGAIQEALYHPQLIDTVNFYDATDSRFNGDRQFEIPIKLINNWLKAQIKTTDVTRHQIYHVDYARHFGDVLITPTGKNESAVLLLQLAPDDTLTANYFDIVRQAVLIVLATKNANNTAFYGRARLNEWIKFAQDTWDDRSDVNHRLKMAQSPPGRPTTPSNIQRKDKETAQKIRQEAESSGVSIKTIKTICRKYGMSYSKFRRDEKA